MDGHNLVLSCQMLLIVEICQRSLGRARLMDVTWPHVLPLIAAAKMFNQPMLHRVNRR